MEPRLAINNDQGPGPPVRPYDWVTPLSVGTKFLCQDKKTKDILELEVLARSSQKFVKLVELGQDPIDWKLP